MNENRPPNGSKDPRQILKKIISDEGDLIIKNPIKFRSLFNDLTRGECKRESNLLFDSISENIPTDLIKNQESFEIIAPRLIERLFDSRSIDKKEGKWAVYTWAFALGIISLDKIPAEPIGKKFQKEPLKSPELKTIPPVKKEIPRLTITSSPQGATVLIDGHYMGITPLDVKYIADGNRQIELDLKGYEVQSKSVRIPSVSTVHFDLNKIIQKPSQIKYPLSITSDPAGATIFLDGNYEGLTPCNITFITSGPHNIRCKLDGYEESTKIVIIPITPKLNFSLIPKNGILLITSEPAGAELHFDGKYEGFTPVGIHKVSYGSHNVRISLSGYDQYYQKIIVPDDGNIHVQLIKEQKGAPGHPSPIQTQNPVNISSKTIFERNKNIFYGAIFCFGLVLVGLVGIGLFSATYGHSQHATVPNQAASAAIIPPVINQSDTVALQKGISLLNSGNYGEALTEFDSAVSANPQSAAAWNYKAFSLFKLGRYDESIQASDKAIALDQNSTAAQVNKGNTLNLLERYSEAIPVFDRVINLDPGIADAWSGKGISYFSLKNYTAAIDSFDHAIGITPTDNTAWEYRGRSLQTIDKYSDAVVAYDTVLKSNPNNAQILLNKGECLNALADYQNASSVFNGVLTSDPVNKRAMTGIGTSLLGQGKYQDALTKFNGALSIDPKYVDALVGKSRALHKLKNYYDGLDAANKALEIDPLNSDAWISKAEIWTTQSKYSDALQAYNEALKNNPDSVDGLMGKADVLIHLDDYDGAIVILEKAITLSPGNKDLWNEKGFALMKKGENNDAIASLDKAIELDPKFVMAWNNKGYALSGAGNYNQSVQAFDKAIEINPNFKDAWIGKSIAYTYMGDFKASEEAAKQGMLIK
jgi:tetratricopeptide (TPR) repeat protein